MSVGTSSSSSNIKTSETTNFPTLSKPRYSKATGKWDKESNYLWSGKDNSNGDFSK